MSEYEPQLRAAAQRGNESLMNDLIKRQRGLNLNCPDSLGNTPLHYSAHHDHPVTLNILLEAGADPNVQNNAGDTPLHKAVAKNSLPCIEALIQNGANPKVENKAKLTPLRMAKAKEAKALLGKYKNILPAAAIDPSMIADAGDEDD